MMMMMMMTILLSFELLVLTTNRFRKYLTLDAIVYLYLNQVHAASGDDAHGILSCLGRIQK